MTNGTTYPLSAGKILCGISELRDQELLCDVHLVAEDESFPAHRVVLAAASPYFKTMFTGGFKENELDTINLTKTSAEGLKCVLDAIYKAEINLTGDNVSKVIPIAHMFHMCDFIRACETYLAETTTVDNCLKYLYIAEKYDLKHLTDKLNDFVINNFVAISKTENINEISKDALCKYLSNDKLRVCNCEIEAFRAAVKWLENNLTKCQQPSDTPNTTEDESAKSVLECVRFPFIPADVLIDEVLHVPFVDENKECRKLVTEVLRFHSNVYTQPLQEGPQYKPRGEEKLMLISGGRRESGYVVQENEMQIHILNTEGTRLFEKETAVHEYPMSFAFRSLSIATKGNSLFLFGVDNRHFNSVAMRLDVSSNTWVYLKAPPTPSIVGSTAVGLSDSIYIFGGMHVTKRSKTMEPECVSNMALKYSIASNSWTELHGMPEALTYHASTGSGDILYTAGGLCGQTLSVTSSKLYAFDTLGTIWLSKAEMNHRRYSMTMKAMRGQIYACGGIYDEVFPVMAIEVYSIPLDQWTVMENAHLEHYLLSSSVVLDEKLYIIGGRKKIENGKWQHTDMVSCVDPSYGTLSQVSNLPFPSSRHACAVLTVP